jgi:hypothetical protein
MKQILSDLKKKLRHLSPSDTHTFLGAVRFVDMEKCLESTMLMFIDNALYHEFYIATCVFIFA